MKTRKLSAFLACAILTALLAGCLNPISFTKEAVPAAGAATDTAAAAAAGERALINQPVVMEFEVLAEGPGLNTEPNPSGRAAAGAELGHIKDVATQAGGIRNFTQLIVLDKDAGKIVQMSSNEAGGKHSIKVNPALGSDGTNYAFLMLTGNQNGNNPPTLLAAGLHSERITAGKKMDLSVMLYPLLVDTQFTTANQYVLPEGRKLVEASPTKAMGLAPVEWNLEWKVQTTPGVINYKDGLTQLIKAQTAAGGADNIKTLFREVKAGFPDADGNLVPPDADTDPVKLEMKNGSPTVTLNITEHTKGSPIGQYIGTTSSANFNLEYVPFSVHGLSGTELTEKWLPKEDPPVWIIRNGLNDLAQDGDTDFSSFANSEGAVRFKVLPNPPQTPPPLVFNENNVSYKSIAGDNGHPEIELSITGIKPTGYPAFVELYYKVVSRPAAGQISTDQDDFSDYTYLATFTSDTTAATKTKTLSEITLDLEHNDVWVFLLLPGGDIIGPVCISPTAEVGVTPGGLQQGGS